MLNSSQNETIPILFLNPRTVEQDENLYRLLLKHVRSPVCQANEILHPIAISTSLFAFWVLYRQKEGRKQNKQLCFDSTTD